MHSNLAGASSSAVPQIGKGKEREKYMETNIEKNEEREEQARGDRAMRRIIEENGE